MITALVYFINALVMAFFSTKLYISLRSSKKKNPYLNYFFGTCSSYSIALFVYAIVITTSIALKNPGLLFYGDFIGRIFLYIGTAIAVQIPLYKLFPKSKIRYMATLLILMSSLFFITYNFYNRNYPSVDYLNVVHWNAFDLNGIGLGLTILGVWLPTSFIFLYEAIKDRSVKALLLGLGFLLGSVSGMLQDFGRNSVEYILINLLLAIGFLTIFAGLFRDE